MFQADPYGILGLATSLMCWAFAAVLFRVGASGSVARMLAIVLVVEGITLLSSNYIDMLFSPAAKASTWYPTFANVTQNMHTLGDCAMLALYPIFLAMSLQTKLARPFARRPTQIALAIVAAALFFGVVLPPPHIGVTLLFATLTSLFAYALITSIHAWRTAAPGIARTRAGIFALAFGFRDLCWGSIYTYGISQVVTGTYFDPSFKPPDIINVIYAGGTFLAVPLIAYGILRTQLFDIDLKIRWTIKQSTVAAVFVAVFYIVSEGADRFLSSEFGNFFGLFASALVVFFLAPLQRFAEGVAGTAMPNTEDTPEYTMYRKLQVYESALAEALVEGGISHKERALLDHLREALGISQADTDSLERDLQQKAMA